MMRVKTKDLEMQIIQEPEVTTIVLNGRLDTATAPTLEEVIDPILEDVTALELDFSNLEYISSAGLKVLLYAQKLLLDRGSLVICNPQQEILDVFQVTGFLDILTCKTKESTDTSDR